MIGKESGLCYDKGAVIPENTGPGPAAGRREMALAPWPCIYNH